jgi:predicted permease
MTSPANFMDWRQRARSFSDLAAAYDRPQNLTAPGEPEEILGRLTTGNFFATLGAAAALGRTYGEADDPERVVVISHALWQRRFGSDPRAIGRPVTINDRVRTVVGVMGADFRSVGGQPDAWIPDRLDPEWRGRFLMAIGRMRSGVTLQQAREEMAVVTRHLAAEAPQYNRGRTADLVPLHEHVTGGVRPALLVLLGAVALLLAIACVNVANLLLARAAARRAEVAVRASLGASRGRIVRQMLTESLLLAVLAGVIGIVLSVWVTDAVVRLVPADLALPRADEIRVDARVLGFAVVLCGLTSILFGTIPALLGSAVNLAQDTREGARGATAGRSRVRSALVVAEVGLAVVLLVGAGLLGRSLQQLLQVSTGVRTEGVLTMRLSLSASRYEQEAELRAAMGRYLERIAALPGARHAGAELYLPFTGLKIGHSFTRADRPEPAPGERPNMDLRIVAGDYFRALAVPLLRGRTFDARDNERSARVFVVNDALARRYFPDRDALGARITVSGDKDSGEIVGIVGDVRELGPREDPSPAIYQPFAQQPVGQVTLVIRAEGDPLALAAPAAAAVREIDRHQPVADVRTLDRVLADSVARPRMIVYVLGGFAATAVLLAGLGLYGVVSYSVTQRRRDIAVRVALGAQNRDVVRPILREGLVLSAAGLALGLPGAVAATRAMRSLLFGVNAADPATLAAAAVFLVLVALTASYVPARRATRVDPASALQAE